MPLRIDTDAAKYLFREPLEALLKDRTDVEVQGCYPASWSNAQPQRTVVEFGAARYSDELAEELCTMLTELGAPKGSTLELEEGGFLRQFGLNEVLALNIDAWIKQVGKPDTFDYEEFIILANKQLSSLGGFQGGFQSFEGFNMYFSGPDARSMEQVLRVLVDAQLPDLTARFSQIA